MKLEQGSKLNPTGQTVLIEIVTKYKLFAEDVKSKIEGFTLPILKEGAPEQGIVFAIGSGIEKPGYKVGDKVVFKPKVMPQGFWYGDRPLVPMPHEEILAVVRGKKS